MLVLVSGASQAVEAHRHNRYLGQLITPHAGNVVRGDLPWAADNGAFSGFRRDAFDRMMARLPAGGLFVVAPDVVADARRTLKRWKVWAPEIRRCGHRPAFVLQDGCELLPDDAGAVFVGGSTEFKLSRDAEALCREAKARGLWVHMGRVNTRRRVEYAQALGCDSIDGTSVSMFPDRRLPEMLRWVESADRQLHLFGGTP